MHTDANGRPIPSSENPPHMWLVTPNLHICVLCQQPWQAIPMPYEPCWTAPAYAKLAIMQAEQAAGLSIEDFYRTRVMTQGNLF